MPCRASIVWRFTCRAHFAYLRCAKPVCMVADDMYPNGAITVIARPRKGSWQSVLPSPCASWEKRDGSLFIQPQGIPICTIADVMYPNAATTVIARPRRGRGNPYSRPLVHAWRKRTGVRIATTSDIGHWFRNDTYLLFGAQSIRRSALWRYHVARPLFGALSILLSALGRHKDPLPLPAALLQRFFFTHDSIPVDKPLQGVLYLQHGSILI